MLTDIKIGETLVGIQNEFKVLTKNGLIPDFPIVIQLIGSNFYYSMNESGMITGGLQLTRPRRRKTVYLYLVEEPGPSGVVTVVYTLNDKPSSNKYWSPMQKVLAWREITIVEGQQDWG